MYKEHKKGTRPILSEKEWHTLKNAQYAVMAKAKYVE
jgi:hypothetical protein